jgi:hexosaminidase
VQDQKIWPRTAVLNERLWNTNIDFNKNLLNIVERLTAHTARLIDRGINASPITVGLCEKDPSICFGTN